MRPSRVNATTSGVDRVHGSSCPDPAVNLARFEALQAKEDQFEQALGDSVVWDEMAGKNDTRVYIVSPFDVRDIRQR
jgi:hypothetical protein